MGQPVTDRKPRVLVVVSAADRIRLREGRVEPTGTYLGELTEPTDAMLAAGFELEFATPGGRIPTIDANSYGLMYWYFSRSRRDAASSSYRRLLELGLRFPAPVEQIAHDRDRLARFDALFIPGGHAPLVDLLHPDGDEHAPNEDVGELLGFFHETGRVTALICHAPAVLTTARADGRCRYAGYRATCFRTVVDRMLEAVPVAGRFAGHLPEHPAEVLTAAGVRVEHTTLPMGRKVVEDRELLTGQDPYSAAALGKAFVRKVCG